MKRYLAVTCLLIIAASCNSETVKRDRPGSRSEAIERLSSADSPSVWNGERSPVAHDRSGPWFHKEKSASDLTANPTHAKTPDRQTEGLSSPGPQTLRSNSEPVSSLDPDHSVAEMSSWEVATVDLDTRAVRWEEAADGYDFLYFTATWCPACRLQQPTLAWLQKQDYRVRLVDIDARPDLAAMFRISSIPAYVAVVDGEVVTDRMGQPKVSHGMRRTSDPSSTTWRIDRHAVLDLIEDGQPHPSSRPTEVNPTETSLRQIALRHDWRKYPAYVGSEGNMNRHDYLRHLVNDHGLSAAELEDWSAFDLFRLHSAVHCANCGKQL